MVKNLPRAGIEPAVFGFLVIVISLNWLYFTILTWNSDVGIDLRFLRL